MPRGGSHRPDGYSPLKLSDGRVLKILKSTNSKTLYFKVVENHKGKFYPKIAVKSAEGKTKYKMIGAGSPSAREAGIVLAKYEDNPWPLPVWRRLEGRRRRRRSRRPSGGVPRSSRRRRGSFWAWNQTKS